MAEEETAGDIDALLDGDARGMAAAVNAGDIAPGEIVEAALGRAEEAPVGALLVVDGDAAREQVDALERRLSRGDRPPLAGVPTAHKDVFDTARFETTYGHPALARRVERDASTVARLERAGAIQLGKANLHEIAYGVTGLNPHTGDITHPTHPGRMPGGSSSGSGAVVASRAVALSLGTDTGGSIRIPASACGVVGLKPTRGAVPTSGVLPLSWLQDHVGPLVRSVGDASIVLRLIAGPDGEDPTTVASPDGWSNALISLPSPAGSIVLPEELWQLRVDPQVAAMCRAAVERLADLTRLELREVNLARFTDARRAQAALLAAHALALHEDRLAAKPDMFGDDVRARLNAGRDITGAQVARALREREHWIAALDTLLPTDTLLASPTIPAPPPSVQDTVLTWDDRQEDITAALTRLTGVWNLAGYPAISVPTGTDPEGLPVGLQLVGRPWSEPSLLATAVLLEKDGPCG